MGYRSVAPEDQQTISVPYVRGDEEGFLTTALIAELNRTGLYQYVNSGGDLELKVAVVGDAQSIIGYRYDRTEKKGHIRPNLMGTENRRQIAAEVTLYRASEDQPILGPVVITAFAEFDYVDVSTLKELAFIGPGGKPQKVIDFSEGQLDSIEGAQDNVLTPLYDRLAKNITVAIQKSYFNN